MLLGFGAFGVIYFGVLQAETYLLNWWLANKERYVSFFLCRDPLPTAQISLLCLPVSTDLLISKSKTLDR